MAKIIRKINNWLEVAEYIRDLKSIATPEKAVCARARQQFWLQAEPNYHTKTYTSAVRDDRLWTFIQKLVPTADLAQVIYGNRGIDWHRDAAYAMPKAWILALGKSTFEIEINGNIRSLDLLGGELIEFDCKQRHRAINIHPERIAIGIWSAKIPIPTELTA